MTEPEKPESELDALMIENPLDLTKEHIDKIIAYQRKHRALLEGGGGRKAAKAADAEKPKIDLDKLFGAKLKPVVGKVERRF